MVIEKSRARIKAASSILMLLILTGLLSSPGNGWQLVNPGDVDKSFLFHKITCETGHHSGNIGDPENLLY